VTAVQHTLLDTEVRVVCGQRHTACACARFLPPKKESSLADVSCSLPQVVLDLGRRPEARFQGLPAEYLRDAPVSQLLASNCLSAAVVVTKVFERALAACMCVVGPACLQTRRCRGRSLMLRLPQ
jgi:hypothetical protein